MEYRTLGVLCALVLCLLVRRGTSSHGLEGKHYSCQISNTTEYRCTGNDFANTTASVPSNATLYHYTALEDSMDLNATDFTHLTRLQVLQLSSPFDIRLHVEIGTVTRDDIFAPLVNLKVLKINIRWFMSHPVPALFAPLVNLTELDLSDTRRLNMNNLLESLEGLRNKPLQALNLWNIQTLEHATNFLFLNLSVMLEPLKDSPVQYLNLGYNGFRSLFPGLIRYTPRLERLILSNNALMPLVTSGLFLEILMHPTLQRVEMGEQGFRPAGIMEPPESALESYTVATKVKVKVSQQVRRDDRIIAATHQGVIRQPEPAVSSTTDWSSIELECIDKESSPGTDPDSLDNIVDIAGQHKCVFFHPRYARCIDVFARFHPAFCQLLYTLEYRTFGGIPCEAIPPITDMINQTCTGCMVLPMGPKLNTIIMNRLNVYDEFDIFSSYQNGTQCFRSNNVLHEIDLSKNYDYGLIGISDKVQTKISGLENVKTFDVSDSGLTAVNPFLFKNFCDLEVLKMPHNRLTFTEDYSEGIFAQNKKLQHIDVSYNNIERFPAKQFSYLTSLKTLDASNNQLREFNLNISGLHNLDYLNLSFNKLQGFERAFTDQLTMLAEASSGNITLDLQYNDLVCTCSNLYFIEWLHINRPRNIILANQAEYVCVDRNSNRVPMHNVDVAAIKEDCNVIIKIVLGSVFGTIGVILLVGLIVVAYWKRWRIRYYMFVAKKMWRSKRQAEHDQRSYIYDAFISYNQDDRFWVHDVLRPKLEDDCGLKVCLHYRDFLGGEFIEDQIIAAIESSRKTVLVLSPNFLKSNWCHFEMQMARNRLFDKGTDVLILVLLEPLPSVGVSSTLARLMETKVYIQWVDNDQDAQQLFWAKMKAAIKGPPETPFQA